MINIDGIEYRTAAQWEKKHRHVLKGQLKKGVDQPTCESCRPCFGGQHRQQG